MNMILLYFMILIPTENYQLLDIKGNTYEINKKEYVIVYLNGWNCFECIAKTTEYFKNQEVPKENIYFVIETQQDIYSKLNLKNLIDKSTDYYNIILFNPENVNFKNMKKSYFLKYSDNNRTPAILIKTDKSYFYQYDSLFKKSSEIKMDSIGLEMLRKIKD